MDCLIALAFILALTALLASYVRRINDPALQAKSVAATMQSARDYLLCEFEMQAAEHGRSELLHHQKEALRYLAQGEIVAYAVTMETI